MRYLLLLVCFFSLQLAWAQKKIFSGRILNTCKVSSKTENISPEEWKYALIETDTFCTYYSKSGSKKISNKYCFIYPDTSKKGFEYYYGIDTLFVVKNQAPKYIEFVVESMSEPILGYKCNTVVKKTPTSIHSTIVLDSAIYTNGNNVILQESFENDYYIIEYKAYEVQETSISDTIFQLPSLIRKPFNSKSIFESEVYDEKMTFHNYIISNLNAELGSQYVPLQPYKHTSVASVETSFLIAPSGKITNIHILNEDKVHPKLVEEVIRVLKNASFKKSVRLFGKPIPYIFTQKVGFART